MKHELKISKDYERLYELICSGLRVFCTWDKDRHGEKELFIFVCKSINLEFVDTESEETNE